MNILTARLDPITRRRWEEVSSTEEQNTLEDLFEFLRRRIQVLDSLPPKFVGQSQQQSKSRPQPSKVIYNAQACRGRCVACSSDHLLHQWSEFQRMAVLDRDRLLKTHSELLQDGTSSQERPLKVLQGTSPYSSVLQVGEGNQGCCSRWRP